MVVSVDPESSSDIPAMLGASAALVLSGVPFAGPIGAARVGYVNGVYVLNPTKADWLNHNWTWLLPVLLKPC